MSKKKSRNSDRRHFVDHETETVYLIVHNWSGAMVAPFWTKEHYPGYDTKLMSSEEALTKLENDRTKNQ